MTEAPRTIPLLGATSLFAVQRLEHTLDAGFAATRVAGLPGEVQQRSGRPSHRIAIAGELVGERVSADLAALQAAAAAGDELPFASDITTALDLQRVVITSFRAVGLAGYPQRAQYELTLAESPPLPPPAQVEAFGGLGEFGLGDLGFDTDIAGDLQSLAGDVAGAVDNALNVIDQLGALANLDGLELGGFLQPMDRSVAQVKDAAARFKDAARGLAEAFG
jgi:hypothetical protein